MEQNTHTLQTNNRFAHERSQKTKPVQSEYINTSRIKTLNSAVYNTFTKWLISL